MSVQLSGSPGEMVPDSVPADSPQPSEPRLRWLAWLAWLLIAGVAVALVVRNATRLGSADPVESLAMMQIQARYLVGIASFVSPSTRASLYEQAEATLDRGSYSHRLRFIVLAGELVDPAEALKKLARLEEDRQSGELKTRDISVVEAARKLERLYAGYEKNPDRPVLSEADQEWLRAKMGWFGELALAPEGGDDAARASVLKPARQTVLIYFSAIGLAVVGFGVGFFLLLLFVFLACLGRLRGGLVCATGRGGIYAETFALYLVVFVGLGLLARLFSVPHNLAMGLSALAPFVSLVVLLWPRFRGVSWRQMRDDLGLHFGAGMHTELLCGLATYLCALPLLVGGALITLLLMLVQKHYGGSDPFAPGAGPSHPINGEVLAGNPWVWLQIFLAACIAAPVVEEIMFRGVLYRHLREASNRWGRPASILASSVCTSFVFAVIHPQGWLGVPPLMALAVAFSLAREWRQSLLSPMIAHGINNGAILLMLLLLAR